LALKKLPLGFWISIKPALGLQNPYNTVKNLDEENKHFPDDMVEYIDAVWTLVTGLPEHHVAGFFYKLLALEEIQTIINVITRLKISHRHWFIALNQIKLDGYNFCGANFSGVHVVGSTFRGSLFYKTNFSGISGVSCDFTSASFTDTDFSNSDLAHSDFSGCDFKDVIFDNADVRGCLFTRCKGFDISQLSKAKNVDQAVII
jgi:uncharacterized protein YjbI with pentapeptide repeats